MGQGDYVTIASELEEPTYIVSDMLQESDFSFVVKSVNTFTSSQSSQSYDLTFLKRSLALFNLTEDTEARTQTSITIVWEEPKILLDSEIQFYAVLISGEEDGYIVEVMHYQQTRRKIENLELGSN
jgi:hypothetical protein